jgi:hypothetical protein
MEKSLEVQGIRVTRQKFAIVASRLVCLNFKVPMQVRQQFKIYAAQHDMTMTEMLLQLLDSCLNSGDHEGAVCPLTKLEMKK